MEQQEKGLDYKGREGSLGGCLTEDYARKVFWLGRDSAPKFVLEFSNQLEECHSVLGNPAVAAN